MDSNHRKKDSIPLKNIQVQVKNKKKSNLNPLYNDSNPIIWKCEEHMKDLNSRKMDSNSIYRMKLKAKD